MACNILRDPDNPKRIIFMCGGKREPTCRYCVAVSSYLCDYPYHSGKTCDRPLCPLHAHTVGEDQHVCPGHQEDWYQNGPGRQISLFPNLKVVK